MKLCLKFIENDFILHGYYDAIKLNLATMFALVSCKIYRCINTSDVSAEFGVNAESLRNFVEELIAEKKFFGSIEGDTLTMNLASGRTENLIEKGEELLQRCDRLLDLY